MDVISLQMSKSSGVLREETSKTEKRQTTMEILHSLTSVPHGYPGILRYKGEYQEMHLDREDAQEPRSSSEMCEFCCGKAWPPLHTPFRSSEEFCCAEYGRLFDMVARESGGAWNGPVEPTETMAHIADVIVKEEEELRARTGALEESRQQQKAMQQYYNEAKNSHTNAHASDHYIPHTNTIAFRLSDGLFREDMQTDAEFEPRTFLEEPGAYEHGVPQHQEIMTFTEKYYSNGKRFLTAFPDGSVQVLYPSGNLALVISSGTERVCIIQDDQSLRPSIIGMFQSNGRATCYHSGGTIWLNMNMWGGQCLSTEGERTKRWYWSQSADIPTPLRPIFLSLNKNIGVRVLGQQQVFVSFLAMGLQAKFKVGATLQPKEYATAAPPKLISTEDLLLLAARIGLLRLLQRLQSCYQFPSNPRSQLLNHSTYLQSLVRKLRALTNVVPIGPQDRVFIDKYIENSR